MNSYQILSIVGSIAAFVISTYLYQQHSESRFHRIYATAFVIVGFFSFFLFGLSVSKTPAQAWIWLSLSSVVHLIPPITLHAILQVSKNNDEAVSRWTLFFLYLPFLLFIVQDGLFTSLSYEKIIDGPFGWEVIIKTDSIYQVINMVGYFVCIGVQGYKLAKLLLYAHNRSKKRFALFVSITYLIPIFICAILIFIVPYFHESILRMETVFVFIVCATTVACLYRLNIFDLSVNIVSKDIIAGMSNFLLILNPNREIIYINSQAAKLTATSENQLINKSIDTLLAKNDIDRIFLQGNMSKQCELDVRRPDGKHFPAIISVAGIVKKNEFLGYILIGNDLTNVRNLIEEKKIIELELKALVRQMNPHFLFNSLNGLQHFILKQDEVKANEYISKFASLMRNILHCTEFEEIALNKELDNIRLYLELEHLRFHKRFEYDIHIDESVDTRFVKIPTMIIQPFIENAIWHGLLPKESDALLEVTFVMDESYLQCKINDNGIGRELSGKLNQRSRPNHQSTAIKNIYERIELLNKKNLGNPMNVTITDLYDNEKKSTGTCVELLFPIKLSLAS